MFIADFHVHSRYSRATSRACAPEFLDLWARRKGLMLIGTGDFTHRKWREELAEKLVPAGDGLYALRPEFRQHAGVAGDGEATAPRFVVTGEISSIYKKNGRVRKVHNLIALPGLDAAERLAKRLEAIGNLHSDGRPILGLDSRDLMQIALDTCPDALFIPAHIWTPHFSLFGAYSGFDAIEECFEDMTPHIAALETGLSSDPAMNWRLSALDRFALISNSDAHSPPNLAREANLFDTGLSYPAVARSLGARDTGFLGTIEFFPEEGKYHLDGHRACKACMQPAKTRACGGLCPVCGKKVTLGVLHRVEALADRPEGYVPPNARRYERLVPLPELVAASLGVGPASARANGKYLGLLAALGPELFILRQAPLSDIGREGGELVAEGVRRLRLGQVDIKPGYDGLYGVVSVMTGPPAGQLSFLTGGAPESAPAEAPGPAAEKGAEKAAGGMAEDLPYGLNRAQWAAVSAEEKTVAVVAGPGTGKTRTLVARIADLVERRGSRPGGIAAVTFTNKAAREMRQRLRAQMGDAAEGMTIGTFHAIGLRILAAQLGREASVADEADSLALVREALDELGLALSPRDALRAISMVKNGAAADDSLPPGLLAGYDGRLRARDALDYDDILLRVLALYENARPEDDGGLWAGFEHLLVDEFQDINALQYRLIGQWRRGGAALFVIGDPDQAIYGFRGADAACFDRLPVDWPGARRIDLTLNYRSTPEIVRCGRLALAGRAAGGELIAMRPGGVGVRLLVAEDAADEAACVAREIGRAVGGLDMLGASAPGAIVGRAGRARGFSDIAVLYRTNRQAEALAQCLRREGIPHTVTGRGAFLAQPEVRRAIAFLRLIVHPDDGAARRTCLKAGVQPDALDARLASIGNGRPAALIRRWIEGEALAPTDALTSLLDMALLYGDIAALVRDLTLGGEGDLKRSGRMRYSPDAVSLMTMHAAKGLEFPVVFLCGVADEFLPLRDRAGRANPDEERRILYVGMTRAQDELILVTYGQPSPFLADLPKGALQSAPAGPRRQPAATQVSLFD